MSILNFKNLSNLFKLNSVSSYNNQQEQEIEINVNPLNSTDSDWLELSVSDNQNDFMHICKEDYAKESEINEIGNSVELAAKYDSYALSVSDDKFNQTKGTLKEKGYILRPLGTDKSRNKGINLYALVNQNDPNAPLTILCRGTQVGDASMIADLDPNGPGYTVLSDNIDVILQQINELIEENSIEKLRITGHSLGGSLAQLLTHYALKVKQEKTYANLSKVSQIETVVFQSAGVNQRVANEVQENLINIKSEDPDFSMKFIAHVQEGDLVPQISGTYLFSDVPPELAEVYLMFKNFNKPYVTLGETLDIGVSFMISGGILSAAKYGAKLIGQRLVSDSLKMHSEYFYHNTDDKTASNLVHGYYSNFEQAGKDKIKSVFEKDLLESVSKYIPGMNKLRSGMFNILNGYENQDIQSGINKATYPAAASFVGYNLMSSKKLVQDLVYNGEFRKTASAVYENKSALFNATTDIASKIFRGVKKYCFS